MSKRLLGDLLVEGGEITKEQLDKAITLQKNSGGMLGIILKDMGFIDDQILVKYISKQSSMG